MLSALTLQQLLKCHLSHRRVGRHLVGGLFVVFRCSQTGSTNLGSSEVNCEACCGGVVFSLLG